MKKCGKCVFQTICVISLVIAMNLIIILYHGYAIPTIKPIVTYYLLQLFTLMAIVGA